MTLNTHTITHWEEIPDNLHNSQTDLEMASTLQIAHPTQDSGEPMVYVSQHLRKGYPLYKDAQFTPLYGFIAQENGHWNGKGEVPFDAQYLPFVLSEEDPQTFHAAVMPSDEEGYLVELSLKFAATADELTFRQNRVRDTHTTRYRLSRGLMPRLGR